MIIVAAPSNRRKAGIPIHVHRWIAVADFKMHARQPIVSCAFDKVAEQDSAYSTPMMGRLDCEQQQLALVCNSAS